MVLYPTVDDLKWFLFGLITYSVMMFGGLYLLEFFRHITLKESLLVLACVLPGGMFWVFILEPRLDTRIGDVLLFSFFAGWSLGWSILGIPMFKHKRGLENEQSSEPSAAEIEVRSYDAWVSERLAVPMAIFMIVLSDGVMLWMVSEIMIEGMNGDLFYLSIGLVFAIPNLLSILLAIYAWKKRMIRFFMLAATISGFSFAGPIAIVAEILLWRAYRIGGWSW